MLLWIPVTAAAASLQVARNAAQRRVLGDAGPWGATLVRFAFGLPFSAVFAVALWGVLRAPIDLSSAYWIEATTGAVSQVLATACLLVAMRRAGFAVGTSVQQSSLPLSGVFGWLVFGDALSPLAWVGVGIASIGLVALTWPRKADSGEKPVSGALFGLGSGVFFGFSLNAYRHAALALSPHHALFAAAATVTITQALQTVGLGLILAFWKPVALRAVASEWRASLFAGFCGACASICWLMALALAPAAPVRAVGTIEAPIAALAGRRLFSERLSLVQWLAALAATVGVAMTALG